MRRSHQWAVLGGCGGLCVGGGCVCGGWMGVWRSVCVLGGEVGYSTYNL